MKIHPRNFESIDLHGFEKWDDTKHTPPSLEQGLFQLFNDVAPDLGVDDIADEHFRDYASDTMSDSGVSFDNIDKAVEWMISGSVRGQLVLSCK